MIKRILYIGRNVATLLTTVQQRTFYM